MNQTYPFTLPSLPYAYDALEPFINKKTIEVHHDTLFNNYVTRLNAALKDYPQYHSYTLEQLILENDRLPADIQTPVFNNAGGVYNHTLYFETMEPKASMLSNYIQQLIQCYFTSLDNFKAQMLAAGLSVFGSGYSWLVMNCRGNLKIITTKNQDTPLSQGYVSLLPLDVWEHAYFLQYLAARNDYIDAWFNLVNWSKVEQLIRNGWMHCDTQIQ